MAGSTILDQSCPIHDTILSSQSDLSASGLHWEQKMPIEKEDNASWHYLHVASQPFRDEVVTGMMLLGFETNQIWPGNDVTMDNANSD